MQTERYFLPGDRYRYDFGECSMKNGYAQVDTANDAHYFGTWANPETLTVFSYTEGDCCRQICDNTEEFIALIREIKAFYGEDFRGVDPGLEPDAVHTWQSIGLSEVLHASYR